MLVIKVTPLTQQSNIFIQHYYPLSQFLENTLGSDRINHLPKMPCCAAIGCSQKRRENGITLHRSVVQSNLTF